MKMALNEMSSYNKYKHQTYNVLLLVEKLITLIVLFRASNSVQFMCT